MDIGGLIPAALRYPWTGADRSEREDTFLDNSSRGGFTVATYEDWNQALKRYFTEGVPGGTRIFLSIDDDVLIEIGGNLAVGEPNGALEAAATQRSNTTAGPESVRGEVVEQSGIAGFCLAVRRRVWHGDRIDTSEIIGRQADGAPLALGFLCAMVLAASRMAEEEEISQLNYFARLRGVLDIPHGQGRPRGLPHGTEEPLWLEWNRWVLEDGLLPTARRGEGPTRYIQYPISQALLRGADKARLRGLFAARRWRTDWDAESLFSQVRQDAVQLTRHLRELLSTTERSEALMDAIHDVYEVWREDPTSDSASTRVHASRLFAGIYRVEDPIHGEVAYHLYPRMARGRTLSDVRVGQPDGARTLTEERRGWYLPLSPVTREELENGAHYPVEQSSDLEWLILPPRDFWILLPDADAPGSGVFASWGSPPLGVPFILLCKSELVTQLTHLRDEGLVEWTGSPEAALDGSWVELRDCMAVSGSWAGVFIESGELFDALRPSVSINLVPSGGLRIPDPSTWIDRYGPQITVYSVTTDEVEISVRRIVDDSVVWERTHPTNNAVVVPWPGPGDYTVEAAYADQASQRLIKIIGWDQASLASLGRGEATQLGKALVRGAAIDEVAT